MSKAQGTLEYLIIISVIIVIALAVVVIVLGGNDTTKNFIDSSNEQTANLGPISITEAAFDSSGNGIIHLLNNSGDTFTITQLYSKDNPNLFSKDYSVKLQPGGVNIEVTDINTVCPCDGTNDYITCNLVLVVKTALKNDNGLERKYFFSPKVTCAPIVNVTNDTFSPIVELISPSQDTNTSSKTVQFDFNVSDSSDISKCELLIDGVSDTNKTSSLTQGINRITKTFTSDNIITWSINCYDTFANKGSSDTFSLEINSSPYEITNCVELQNIQDEPYGDYYLMNDIDCSETSTWDPLVLVFSEPKTPKSINLLGGGGGPTEHTYYRGFNPIDFFGMLEGNGHIISNLQELRNGYAGIFSTIESGAIVKNLGVYNASITSQGYSGIISSANNGIIENVFTTGGLGKGCPNQHCVITYGPMAGLVYNNTGTISNSYSLANANSDASDAGLVSVNDGDISSSYSTGTVSGYSANGGLVSTNNGTIEDSFATGLVYGGNGFVYTNNGTISGSYWDINKTNQTNGGCNEPDCIGINNDNTNQDYFYFQLNSPLATWDFDSTWSICEGENYPTLKWENKSC